MRCHLLVERIIGRRFHPSAKRQNVGGIVQFQTLFFMTIVGLTAFLASAAAADAAEPKVDFNFEIRPLLSDRCFKCHGPDESNREAELRLDSQDGAFADLDLDDADAVIVAGKSERSELWHRIASDDPDVVMPPADSNLSLSDEEKKLIQRWIDEGAEWKRHWSFIPVRRPAVPEVGESDWPRNSIDHFTLHRMESAGFQPAEIAGPEQLIRRVCFDLTGLPPTVEQVRQFQADHSPEAYERLVDELLASERFGERMAADWLDVARYSDTYGYQVDRDRFVWPWRDWVIRALNRNLSYDQFVAQQLAGDLMPGATKDQILATTFNRLHPQKVEGGSVPEEFRIEYVTDRAQTVSTAFLGLTMECARCHDHKYDPLSQREYYSLVSFFDNIDEAGLYSYFTNSVPTPTLRMSDAAQEKRSGDAAAKVAAATRALEKARVGAQERYAKWLSSTKQLEKPAEIPGQVAHLDFENDIKGPNSQVEGRIGKAVQLTGDDGVKTKVGNFARWQPFSVSLWLQTPDEKERAVVFHRSRAWTDAASRGYQLLIEDGQLSASLIHFWPGNAIRIRTREKLPVAKWVHVVMNYDGSSQAEGLTLFVNGRTAETTVVRDNLYKNITGGGGNTITIGERFRDRGFTGGMVDDFRVFDRQLTDVEIQQVAGLGSVEQRFKSVREGDQKNSLFEYYVANHDAEHISALAALLEARKAACQLQDALQEIMVMQEMPAERTTFLLNRGSYDQPTEPVKSETPVNVLGFNPSLPRNRLGLAQWMADRENPLPSRVAVNRLWQLCFGEGLVRTPEDFGSQGALPTHPALLDWLADDFMSHDWDIKRMMKQIVMSSTYRQSSRPREGNPDDPENNMLARTFVFRLPAEMLRDNALAVSGLLVDEIGGAPAKPYELEVSFKPTKPDSGKGLYRRSLYTYWKRTAPAPMMMTLDASKREVCRVKRERTDSPLQAFVMLNGPQFIEAARVLAAKALAEQPDPDEAIRSTFLRLTSRDPEAAELKVMRNLFDNELKTFSNDTEAARKLISIGGAPVAEDTEPAEVAAMTIVVSTLMNYDESVMHR